ncbi:MAG: hypothetical protein ABI664_09775 [bacterium]
MLGVIAGAGLIRTSGHAAGSTRWSTPVITTRPDGSASIAMNVTYVDGDRQIGGIAILGDPVVARSARGGLGGLAVNRETGVLRCDSSLPSEPLPRS